MTTPETKEPTCSTREAADLLGIVERTVLLYIERGELQGRRTGRRWQITRASVEKHPHFGTSADSPPLRPTRTRIGISTPLLADTHRCGARAEPASRMFRQTSLYDDTYAVVTDSNGRLRRVLAARLGLAAIAIASPPPRLHPSASSPVSSCRPNASRAQSRLALRTSPHASGSARSPRGP